MGSAGRKDVAGLLWYSYITLLILSGVSFIVIAGVSAPVVAKTFFYRTYEARVLEKTSNFSGGCDVSVSYRVEGQELVGDVAVKKVPCAGLVRSEFRVTTLPDGKLVRTPPAVFSLTSAGMLLMLGLVAVGSVLRLRGLRAKR